MALDTLLFNSGFMPFRQHMIINVAIQPGKCGQAAKCTARHHALHQAVTTVHASWLHTHCKPYAELSSRSTALSSKLPRARL